MKKFLIKNYKELLLAIFLWLSWLDLPEPPIVELDPSWQSVLSYTSSGGFQFGKDVVFSYGPYGWLLSHYVLPQQLEQKLFYEIIFKLFLSVYIILNLNSFHFKKKVFFVFLYCLSGIYFTDNFTTSLIILIFYFVLCKDNISLPNIILGFIILSFFAHTKFTFTILVFSSILLSFFFNIKRCKKTILFSYIVFPCAYLSFWFFADQDLSNLSHYFLNSFIITQNYSLAMSLNESFIKLICGLTCISIVLIPCILLVYDNKNNLYYLPLPIMFVISVFLVWKHGFVRADNHVLATFGYLFSIAFILPEILRRHLIYKPFILTLIFSFLGITYSESKLITHAVAFIPQRYIDSIHYLSDIDALFQDYDKKYYFLKSQNDLTDFKDIINNQSIDTIDNQQAVLFLNDLNYTPRPVIQNYKAYSKELVHLNNNFILSQVSPRFLFWKHGYIDNRFPGQGDSLLTASIPFLYSPLLESPYGLLLKRKSNTSNFTHLKLNLIYESTSEVGASHIIESDGSNGIWLKCNFKQSLVGVLRSFIYKPPLLHVEVTDSLKTTYTHRIIPSVTPEGFLLHPYLKNQYDLRLFSEFKSLPPIKSIRFKYSGTGLFDTIFWDEYDVKVFTVENMPLEIVSPHEEFVKNGISNVIPHSVKCIGNSEIFYENNFSNLLIHAPSDIVFKVTDENKIVSGNFGLRKESYEGSSTCDGVIFGVFAIDDRGTEFELFSKYLNPHKFFDHRGRQSFKIDIPSKVSKLAIRFSEGVEGDMAWDWSYVSNIKLY